MKTLLILLVLILLSIGLMFIGGPGPKCLEWKEHNNPGVGAQVRYCARYEDGTKQETKAR